MTLGDILVQKYRFYMDETDLGGFPFQNLLPRNDGLNCFCYAGVLITEEDIEFIRHNHKVFCAKWGIDYPLHYNAIRSRSGNFKWLKAEKGATNRDPETFVQEYHDFMAEQPYRVVGSCIHKKEDMSKADEPLGKKFETIRLYAFERTIFYLLRSLFQNEEVSVHIEKSGKNEDNQLINYLENFKSTGITAIDGKLTRVDKSNPFTQIADFCAYVIAKASKDENYRPYVMLKKLGKFD